MGHRLFQQLDPLFAEVRKIEKHAGHLSARPRQALDQAACESDSRSSATIGVVALAARAAWMAAGLTGSMTSTLRSASSIASGAMRFGSPLAARATSSILSGSR